MTTQKESENQSRELTKQERRIIIDSYCREFAPRFNVLPNSKKNNLRIECELWMNIFGLDIEDDRI